MKDDCLLYSQKFKKCIGLTELLCKKGKCSFYKPKHKPEEKEAEKNGNTD